MAIDYIKLTPAGNYRAAVANRFLRKLREALEAGREVAGIFAHKTEDPDYTGLEGVEGFGVAAGQGQTFYNLITGAFARVNDAGVINAIDRIGE